MKYITQSIIIFAIFVILISFKNKINKKIFLRNKINKNRSSLSIIWLVYLIDIRNMIVDILCYIDTYKQYHYV